jgi:signal peptidase I
MPAPIIDHVVERVRLPESLTRLLVRAAIAQRLRRELELREDGVGEFAKMLALGQRQSRRLQRTCSTTRYRRRVVIFHPPEGAEQEECGPTSHVIKLGGAACSEPIPQEDTGTTFIKRVVAGPGDEIYVKEGHVYRKAAGSSAFVEEQNSSTRECGVSPECNFPTPIKIPADHWYLMGDNRGESDDSRFWGSVPSSWVVGVVTGTE